MLFAFDNEFYKQGFTMVAGIDEAGRGPLAGPVFAAAVILDNNKQIKGLGDSKKLTAQKRQELFPVIKEKAVAYSIAFADEKEIDDINILNATFLAMRRAVEGLNIKPDIILVDGNGDPKIDCKTELIIKGDAKSASIAAASILAKVARDNMITELGQMYPDYFFSQHKGYPTKLHYEMLDKFGPCPIHRKSFLKKWEAKRKNGND